jgi:protein gp37
LGETSIAWTDRTRNLVYGCRKVDTDILTGACHECYIFRNLPRYGVDPNKLTYLSVENSIKEMKKWSRDPGVKKIFLNNYSDTFHEDIPFETIDMWVEKIIEAFPNFEFQLLTKRIGRAMMYWQKRGSVPRNVWMGCTIGAKNRLKRLDQLRQIPAKIRWVSAEPLLEDLGEFSLEGIQWIVVGGESGLKPRPMDPVWAENIRRIAERDGVVYFFKQNGGVGFDNAGGCILNGKEYKAWPNWERG